MRGEIFRIVFAGALVGLLALAFAACGGDDDEGGTTVSNQGAAAQQGQDSAAGKGGEEKAAGDDSRGGSGAGSQTAAPVEPAPLRVSGGGSEQFRVKGGDNSIQTWGEESDESQLDAAAEAVHGFYVARANEEWAEACEYLGTPLLQQLRQFASQSGSEVPECPELLKTLTRHPLPASVRRESTIVDAGSLRIGEDNSFLIYRGVDQTVFAMPVVEEDGAWKVTLLSPTTLG
ncbi:MAG TPA: hypothetical protein VF255_05625 [Solirubrobacterales bacterium]